MSKWKFIVNASDIRIPELGKHIVKNVKYNKNAFFATWIRAKRSIKKKS